MATPVTYDEIVDMTSTWPRLEPGNWYGTPGLKVGGKGFCRMWSEREYKRDGVDDTEVLVVMSDLDEKPLLIDAAKGVLFETPHYHGHGAMLVRLADVDRNDLLGYLEDAYRLTATKKIRNEFDETISGTPGTHA